MGKHIVFVYGTLKQGYGNHRLLDRKSKFLGDGVTEQKFDMLNSGFPVLIENDEGKHVAGEVYEIDDNVLRDLDRLESEGTMYDRKKVKVWLDDNTGSVIADIYIGTEHWKKNEYDLCVTTSQDGHLDWRPTR